VRQRAAAVSNETKSWAKENELAIASAYFTNDADAFDEKAVVGLFDAHFKDESSNCQEGAHALAAHWCLKLKSSLDQRIRCYLDGEKKKEGVLKAKSIDVLTKIRDALQSASFDYRRTDDDVAAFFRVMLNAVVPRRYQREARLSEVAFIRGRSLLALERAIKGSAASSDASDVGLVGIAPVMSGSGSRGADASASASASADPLVAVSPLGERRSGVSSSPSSASLFADAAPSSLRKRGRIVGDKENQPTNKRVPPAAVV